MVKPSREQLDALKELINIGVGRAAGVLSQMIQCHIVLQVPFVKITSPEALIEEMGDLAGDRLTAVKLGFKGSFTGTAALVFPSESASKLVTVLTSEESDSSDLDSLRVGTLSEVGNIVINGVMGSISNVLRQHIDYSLPAYLEDVVETMFAVNNHPPNSMVLLADTRFTIEQLHITGDIVLIFETGSFGALIEAINRDL